MALLRRGRELLPNNIDMTNDLAWQLATTPDASVRDGAEAVRWAEQCVKSTDPAGADVLDTLAAAYAEAGRWDDAVATAREAIELANTTEEEALAGQIAAHLRLYEQQQPLRDRPTQ